MYFVVSTISYPLGNDFSCFEIDSADVGTSFAIPAELNGKGRRQPASVQSGTNATSYTSKIDSKEDECINGTVQRVVLEERWSFYASFKKIPFLGVFSFICEVYVKLLAWTLVIMYRC